MRNPDRIPAMIEALRALWTENHDQRLGQLVANLGEPLPDRGEDLTLAELNERWGEHAAEIRLNQMADIVGLAPQRDRTDLFVVEDDEMAERVRAAVARGGQK